MEHTAYSRGYKHSYIAESHIHRTYIRYANDTLRPRLIIDDSSANWSDSIIRQEAQRSIQTNAIAVRLHSTSQDAAMFGQLFPIPSVPSIFFIKAGTLCGFLQGNVTEQQLIDTINAANGGAESATGTAATSIPSTNTTSNHGPTPAPSTETAPMPMPSSPSPIVSQPVVSNEPIVTAPATNPTPSESTLSPPTSTASSTPSQTHPSQTQVERLRTQLAERRKQREKEEKEAAKRRELERRSQQKSQQSVQKSLEEKGQLKIAEEKRKERLAEAEHKKRVKEQIAADKAERQAKRDREIALRNGLSEPGNVSPISRSSTSSPSVSSRSLSSTSCALVVRLLDGSTIKNTFSATDTLDKVREWIDETRSDGDAPYILIKTFPNHQFTAMEETKALKDIELCPSAALICKPTKKAAEAYTAPSSLVGAVAGTGWGLVRGGVGLALGGVNMVFNAVSRNAPSIEAERGHAVGEPTASTEAAAAAERRAASASTNASASGNVHSLKRDDDDKQQFYNGNSVNQE